MLLVSICVSSICWSRAYNKPATLPANQHSWSRIRLTAVTLPFHTEKITDPQLTQLQFPFLVVIFVAHEEWKNEYACDFIGPIAGNLGVTKYGLGGASGPTFHHLPLNGSDIYDLLLCRRTFMHSSHPILLICSPSHPSHMAALPCRFIHQFLFVRRKLCAVFSFNL